MISMNYGICKFRITFKIFKVIHWNVEWKSWFCEISNKIASVIEKARSTMHKSSINCILIADNLFSIFIHLLLYELPTTEQLHTYKK